MIAFLVVVFIAAMVIALAKIFFLIALPEKIEDKSYVFLTTAFWLGLAAWSMYWMLV